MKKYLMLFAVCFYSSFSLAQNVGIGTATPQSKLHVNGTSWFSGDNTPLPASAGKGIAIGQSGDNGYIFSFDYGTFTPRNLLLQSPGGNVGIGTATPATKLTVNSTEYGIEHTDGNRSLSTFLNTTGGWIGTTSNHPLHFYTNDGNSQMTLNQSGFLGIGTTNPLVKLHINGIGVVESSVQSSSERAILSLNSTIGGQNRVWTLENGLFGTAGLFGIYDRTAGQGRLTIQPSGPIDMQGNITQNLGGYGLPKAMVFINGDGTIIRCYNGVSGATTGGCGFTTGRIFPSCSYYLLFPFDISSRFFSVSVEDDCCADPATVTFQRFTNTQLKFDVFLAGTTDHMDRPIVVIVY